MRRRTLLQCLTLLPLGLSARAFAANVLDGAQGRDVQSSLFAAYLDTLIPADQTPAASALGVDRRLLAQARRSLRARRLLLGGLKWLEKEARRQGGEGFLALDEPARIKVVSAAEGSPARSLQRRFFEYTRDAAMQDYYSDPRSWQSLAVHPPQPLGYPAYHEVPR